METAETNRQNGSAPASRTEEGIVTVVSAAEAAAARAGAAVAVKTGDTACADRLARQADRAARGEADHNATGILLYALSTVRPPFLPLPVSPSLTRQLCRIREQEHVSRLYSCRGCCWNPPACAVDSSRCSWSCTAI